MAAARNAAPVGDEIGREARRLLAALTGEGASSGRTDLRDGFIVVSAPRNGVTSIIANTPIAAGDDLVARDLARWAAGATGRVLQVLPEGVACARRIAARAEENPYAAQHRSVVVKTLTRGGAPVAVDERESPLAWLARRKGREGTAFLTPAQVEAGERFGRDVTVAQLVPRVTSDWSGLASSGDRGPDRLNVSDLAIAARQRLDRAAAAVGPEINGLLIDVCGFQKGLELVERERKWPPRAAKVVLRIALDSLAAHYGLASAAHGPARSPGVRRWGAADYRPQIDASE